ncbi:PREDICTED: probable purine permease 10 [Theobroma cacao]|uniref:Probable purine permease n=1 Tax=Theobroma cacao TaxID=3641 RepID=A0AB32WHG4_THECC|nr:PREDICTED: probable purine permease 10 [Theobroma cacao]
MAEAQRLQLPIISDEEEAKEENPAVNVNATNREITVSRSGKYKRWLRVVLYTIFLLCGQSVATLLGRLYYEKGGNSKWLAALVQLAGFPILLPFYCMPTRKMFNDLNASLTETKQPSFFKLVLVYVSIGLLIAGNCFLYSVGMQYLPVSTITLISASQLAFNAFFSYFLNSQKFTPFMINSLVLLTISSVLLVFQDNSARLAGVSHGQYAAGFICTIFGTAGTGLFLALQQLAFRKVVKRQTFTDVMDMIIFPSLIASSAILVGFLASGDWKGLNREMKEYELGNFSYVMILLWTAICWAVLAIGAVGLVFEVSALFYNAISVFGLPIVPIIAVFVFHDKMDGIKVISMVLAIWGFISYVYQHYLDDYKSKTEKGKTSGNL